ncbi:hypothetical protein WDW86_12990 [Bdellovibrionota bacterium FG-2]
MKSLAVVSYLSLFATFVAPSFAETPHDCICPYDETILASPGTQSCGQISCPACGHLMVRALYVGGKPDGVFQNKNNIEQPTGLQSVPGVSGIVEQQPLPALAIAATPPAADKPNAVNTVTYTNTIAGIIEVSCSKCHSGPLRNLMTYENVKVYVDNNLLSMLVRLGGPMNRFAGKDAPVIIDWAKNGAPR